MTDGDLFEYDLFISYAHSDNRLVPGINKTGWVETLFECVKHQLWFQLGREPRLWRDSDNLRHGEAVTKQLIDEVKKARALLVVLSRSYLNSEWCCRELNEFLKLMQERRGIESVFIVEVDQIDRAEIPRELRDLRTFRFWKRLEGGAAKVLGFPRPDEDPDYSDRVVELGFQITRLLQKSPPAPPIIISGVNEPPVSGWPEPSVFLAQVTDDLEMEAAAVRSFLEQQGVSVLPPAGVFYPPTLADFQKEAEKDIFASKYFVQLLSEITGKTPQGVPQGFPAFQCELAERHGKEIVQWRKPGAQVEDVVNDCHRALLERATVQTGSLEVFKHEIIRKIALKEKKNINKNIQDIKSRSMNSRNYIYFFVSGDHTDHVLAKELRAIIESEGIACAMPLRSENPEEIRTDLEENLRLCHGLIVVYGNTTQAWVRRQVLQAQKALAYRETPAMIRGVCVAPPPEKNKDLEDPVGMSLDAVLDCMQGINEREIHKFVERVRDSIGSSELIAN